MSSARIQLERQIAVTESRLERLQKRAAELDSQNARGRLPAHAGAGARALARALRERGPAPDRRFWVGPHADARLRMDAVLDVCEKGIAGPEGDVRRLAPAAKDVLIFIARVLLRQRDFVGTFSADRLALELDLSVRTTRAALRELEDAQLVVVEREDDELCRPIKRVQLGTSLWEIRRPTGLSTWVPESKLSTTRDSLGTTARTRQFSAPPILTHQDAVPCESPLTPLGTAKGVEPAGRKGAATSTEGGRAGSLPTINDHDPATAHGGNGSCSRAIDVSEPHRERTTA